MRKTIYPGNGERFYSPKNFPMFFESFFLERAEVVHQGNFIENDGKKGSLIVYHVTPQNVTLVYSSIKRTKFILPRPDYNDVSLKFSGEKLKVDEIIKIIEKEEQKQSKLENTAQGDKIK